MLNAEKLTADMRRALFTLLDKGALTKGRKGWYPGFSTSGWTAFRPPTVQALIRKGYFEVVQPGGYVRLTDIGRIHAEKLRAEPLPIPSSSLPPRVATRPARPHQPRSVRLPYVD